MPLFCDADPLVLAVGAGRNADFAVTDFELLATQLRARFQNLELVRLGNESSAPLLNTSLIRLPVLCRAEHA